MGSQTVKRTVLMRVMLLKRETYRLSADYRGLRVRSGQAWVTWQGRDLTLKRGEEVALDARKDLAVVSALGNVPLVIELLGEMPQRSVIDPQPITSAL
jgi:hypothetical protein